MNFASDNAYGAHPSVLQALIDCNDGAVMGYGNDPITRKTEDAIRELFGAPDAVVAFVTTGTAANALVCAQLSPGFGRIYCHQHAHIEGSECGAPEFFSGGAKLIALPGEYGKLPVGVVKDAIVSGAAEGLNGGRNAMLSLTNATEWGTTYSPAEVAALCDISHQHGLAVHMDGARFANAVAAQDCSASAISVDAGVDALCFGGTKTGAMGAEALIFFDPALADGFDYRRKQSGHVLSKQRYLAAQMLALLRDGLWLDLASRANQAASRLADGVLRAGGHLLAPVESNAVFARIPVAAHRSAIEAGAIYHRWPEAGPDEPDTVAIRLVTSWNTPDGDLDRMIAALGA